MNRLFRYIKLHLFRDPRYFFEYLLGYFDSRYVPVVHFGDTTEVALAVSNGKSLIRLGDGEIYLLNGGDITFERSSQKMRKLLFQCIKDYSAEQPYLLALNRVGLQSSNKTLKAKNLLNCWLPSKVYFNLYFKRNVSYGDAAMFYFKNTLPHYFEKYLLTRKIILVSNINTCNLLQKDSNTPFVWSAVIVTPEKYAFESYDRIKGEIIDAVDRLGKEEATVLAAFGPASKVLAYELSSMGIQVLDVGQGITAAYGTEDHSLSQNIRMLQ